MNNMIHMLEELCSVYVCVCVSYRFGTVDISCQADNQIMCDGVNQVSEAGVTVEHVIQRCRLHA